MHIQKSLTLVLFNEEVEAFEMILVLAENHACDLPVSKETDRVRALVRTIDKESSGADK